MESTYAVLQTMVVDSRLAARRGVHHREQGRGHVDIIDAAHVGRCRKTGYVRQHAAADSY